MRKKRIMGGGAIDVPAYMAMRFELATRRVTSPDSEIFTPFELQVNFTQKMLALPYQKVYIF